MTFDEMQLLFETIADKAEAGLPVALTEGQISEMRALLSTSRVRIENIEDRLDKLEYHLDKRGAFQSGTFREN